METLKIMSTEAGRQKLMFPWYITDMSEDFNSGRLCFNLQVKLSWNMTLNIPTDDGSHIFETPSDLLGLSLQTRVCSALAWGRSEVRISVKFCFYCGIKQAEAAGQGVHTQDRHILYSGSSLVWMTGTWNEPLFLSGRCGFDATLARSAVDVSSLE